MEAHQLLVALIVVLMLPELQEIQILHSEQQAKDQTLRRQVEQVQKQVQVQRAHIHRHRIKLPEQLNRKRTERYLVLQEKDQVQQVQEHHQHLHRAKSTITKSLLMLQSQNITAHKARLIELSLAHLVALIGSQAQVAAQASILSQDQAVVLVSIQSQDQMEVQVVQKPILIQSLDLIRAAAIVDLHQVVRSREAVIQARRVVRVAAVTAGHLQVAHDQVQAQATEAQVQVVAQADQALQDQVVVLLDQVRQVQNQAEEGRLNRFQLHY